MCRDHVQYPAFAPGTSETAVGFWLPCILYIICPTCACMQLFLAPYFFLVFCCSRRHLFRCKHSRESPECQVPKSQTISIEQVGKYSLLFLENLRIGVQSSLNFCQNSPVKLPGPGLFFVGNFLITNPVFWLVVIYLFRLSISFLVSFVSF